ncbi:hypothetical protein [Halorubellus litoreus]|uniref:Integral membrane protein n=1 Tax=Halorubellus litoreus TaxID=755308 RepID=A0ABD5VBM0_9EURY
MPRRPLALTLLSCWSVLGAALLVALVTVLTDYANTGQVPAVIAGLGVLVAVVGLVVAGGLWRTSTWARPLGVLTYALAGLVALAVAASVDAWLPAAPVLAGNALAVLALARHTAGFEDGERRPDEVNAHVGR